MEAYLPKPVIACDWFSFSIKSHPSPAALPPDFKEEVLAGTNVFNRRAVYSYRGAKVLTVLSQPKSKLIKQDLVLVEVANRWLYDYAELGAILETMFPFYTLNNMSRIDICADFCANNNAMDTIAKIANGAYYVSGKKLGNVWYEEGGDRKPYDLNFGSFRSDVKWKLYNKTKEIKANTLHCSKPWIVAWWRSHGLDETNVWRLEVSYHGEKFADRDGLQVGLWDCYNSDLLSVVFAEFYKYRFQIKERGHTRKANDRVVPFLLINEVTQPYVSRQRAIVRGSYDDSNDGFVLLNRLCKSYTDNSTLSVKVKDETFSLIRSICDEYGYHKYVAKQYGLDIEF